MAVAQKITPFLSFESQAEEAANFYVSVFDDGKIIREIRSPEVPGGPPSTIIGVDFQIAGMHFTALNVGQDWKFTEALSLLVSCDSQREIDHLWERLTDGGEEVQCGWLRDRYGVAWQITPGVLLEMITDKDPAKAQRAFQAMTQMVKLDLAELQRAYDGG